MKKYYLLLFIAFFSFFNFNDSVYAAEGGYFDNVQLPNLTKTRFITQVTDNNLSTGVNVRHSDEIPVFNFEKPEKVVKYYFIGTGCIDFFSDSSLTQRIARISRPEQGWNDLVVEDVGAIYAITCSYSDSLVYEMDFIVESQLVFDPIHKVDYTSSFDSISAEWTMPPKSISTDVYVNNVKVGNTTESKYVFENLKSSTEYEIKFVAVYQNGFSPEVVYKVTTKEEPLFKQSDVEVVDIKNNSARIKINVSKMSGKPDFIYFYINDRQVGQVAISNKNQDYFYTLSNLASETAYTVEVKAKFSSVLSDPVIVEFETVVGNKEVANLTATATATDVSLKWEMPTYRDLDVARIYRQKNDASMFARMFRSASTYEPIFETNGTTFRDLTVSPNTEYTYRVTTVDLLDNETEGSTVRIRTRQMSVSGGGTEVAENGDYVITWDSPVTGRIKVLVGGSEFATVPASDGRIVIPQSQMRFDLFGNPDVQLIPIDEEGNPGIPSRPGSGNNGGGNGGIGDIVGGGDAAEILNPNNVLTSAVSLLAVVGAFLLLGLAFRVVPKLIQTIRTALGERTKKDNVLPGRRT